MTTSSGSSKLTPKITSMPSTNEMYLSAASAVMNASPPKVTTSTRRPSGTTKKASAAPAANSAAAQVTKVSAYLRSLAYRPGVMNAQIWYSHTGLVNTAPIAAPTLSWVRNASNGVVCSRRHSGPGGSRTDDGSLQYGSVTIWPSDGIGPT